MTANRVINAAQSVLDERPETVNRIGMNIAYHIDLFAVIDAPMGVFIPMKPEIIIDRELVCEHSALRQDVPFDNAHDGVSLNVLRGVGADATLALDNSDNGSLFSVSLTGPTAKSASPSADIGFINFDAGAALAAKRSIPVTAQHGTNLLKHAPCGFVGHSSFPLNLLRGNSTTSRGHQIDRVEPCCERRRGLVEDGVSSRVNVMSTVIARIRRATLDAMMLCDRFTGFAIDALGIQVIAKPFKASRIVRELAVKLFLGVRRHLWLAIHKLPTLKSKYDTLSTYCQGIISLAKYRARETYM